MIWLVAIALYLLAIAVLCAICGANRADDEAPRPPPRLGENEKAATSHRAPIAVAVGRR